MHVITAVCWTLLLVIIPYTASRRLFKRYGTCKADKDEPWTYRGRNGPKYWGETYPECNGQMQSPIAISQREAVADQNLPKLFMDNYDVPVTRANIENNGHTVEVTPTDDVDRTISVDGSTYRLMQLHFHWGDAFYRGAEHTVDGIQYSMEMHLVHQNDDNQIAVIGVFFQEQPGRTAELQNIIEAFPKVLYKGTSTELNKNLNLNKLVPANPSSFFRYEGSLTTPPCSEGVSWSVLKNPLPVGHDQMVEFRKLYSAEKSKATWNCKLSNNYRPVQPLNGRTVYVSE